MPRASSTSALPARLVAARLPCLATGTPAAEAIRAAPVDRLRLAEPSPPVPQVSSKIGKLWAPGLIPARIAAAAAAITLHVSLPVCRNAIRNAAMLAGLHAPANMASNTRRTVAGESPPGAVISAKTSLNLGISALTASQASSRSGEGHDQ